jgi:hypothetical protein
MKNRLEPKTPEKTEPPRTEADDRSAAFSQAQSDCRERDPSKNFMAVIWIFGAGFECRLTPNLFQNILNILEN